MSTLRSGVLHISGKWIGDVGSTDPDTAPMLSEDGYATVKATVAGIGDPPDQATQPHFAIFDVNNAHNRINLTVGGGRTPNEGPGSAQMYLEQNAHLGKSAITVNSDGYLQIAGAPRSSLNNMSATVIGELVINAREQGQGTIALRSNGGTSASVVVGKFVGEGITFEVEAGKLEFVKPESDRATLDWNPVEGQATVDLDGILGVASASYDGFMLDLKNAWGQNILSIFMTKPAGGAEPNIYQTSHGIELSSIPPQFAPSGCVPIPLCHG